VGGLPWDMQTSDIMVGCLPLDKVCFGQCFAAHLANKQGINFAKRIRRILDEDLLNQDYNNMPAKQKWVRHGWNSDPSWNWDMAIKVGEITRKNGKHIVYNTKFHVQPTDKQIAKLLEIKAEIRLSLSAIDEQDVLTKRFKIFEKFRTKGGIGIITFISSKYKYKELNERQEDIVKYIVMHDIPAGEMPFRVSLKYGTGKLIEDGFFKVPECNAVWFGRLYPKKLPLPVLASTAPCYAGLKTNKLSKVTPKYIKKITVDPIPTYSSLCKGKNLIPDAVGKAPVYVTKS